MPGSSLEDANPTRHRTDGAVGSVWGRLSSRSKKGVYLLLTASLGLFTAVVGYIEYVSSVTGSEAFLATFAPFVLSLLLMGSMSIFLSVYMSTREGATRSDLLGSFWMLLLLPMSIALYSDFTSVDLLFIILIAASALMLWRGNRNMKWFVTVGALTTIWFVFDPLTHTLDYLSLSAGLAGLGIVRETASLALQRAITDWLRFGFFLAVFVATLKGKQ
ncbi:MAG: hypothetical protein JRM85_09410 [Nitrososphaerota archaeon]|nr:hypothetical protein [Nitrososphaerota archaeon]